MWQRNQYQPPVDVTLTPEERAAIYRDGRVNDAVRNARLAARKYATSLLGQTEDTVSCKEEGARPLSPMDIGGGFDGIKRTMATYGVNTKLCDYAARVCVRLITPKAPEASA